MAEPLGESFTLALVWLDLCCLAGEAPPAFLLALVDGAGAAAGAGAGRLLFGNSTTGMLLGGAAGGLAGNMTLDRQAEERRRRQAVEDRRTQQQLQLDFERQRALQAEQTRIQVEEQRLFEQWRREQGV